MYVGGKNGGTGEVWGKGEAVRRGKRTGVGDGGWKRGVGEAEEVRCGRRGRGGWWGSMSDTGGWGWESTSSGIEVKSALAA